MPVELGGLLGRGQAVRTLHYDLRSVFDRTLHHGTGRGIIRVGQADDYAILAALAGKLFALSASVLIVNSEVHLLRSRSGLIAGSGARGPGVA